MDRLHKSMFVNGKVLATICCHECGKAHWIYAVKKLDQATENALTKIKESDHYMYGASLFAPDSGLHDTVVVCASMTCVNSMEVQYYSASLVSFPPVCFHCGAAEEYLLENEEITELKQQFAVVRPICRQCRSSGKCPATRQPNLMAAKKKKST